MTANLAHSLADELERVVALRERWRMHASTRGGEGAFVLVIAPMTKTIDAAKAALGADDAVASLRAYHAIKVFEAEPPREPTFYQTDFDDGGP
jgi:hypothetical protein